MASGFTTEWMNDILGELFGGVALAAPGTLYFGLCTGVTAGGTITGEPSGNGYSRKSITNDSALWNTPGSGLVDNKVAITFQPGLWLVGDYHSFLHCQRCLRRGHGRYLLWPIDIIQGH